MAATSPGKAAAVHAGTRARPAWRGRDQRRSIALGLALGITVMAEPKLGGGASPGDIGVVATILMALLWTSPQERLIVRRRLRRVIPGIILVAAGSLIALVAVGLPDWALLTIAVDVYLLTFGFFALCLLISERVVHKFVAIGMVPWLAYTVFVGVVQGHAKLGGWFSHPNLNAYALVMVALTIVILWPSFSVRVIVGGAALVGVIGSASFGAVLSGIVGAFVFIQASSTGLKRAVAIGLFVVAAMVVVGPIRSVTARYTESQNSAAEFGSARLDRTAATRYEIWGDAIDTLQEEPFGVGPYGIVGGGERTEVHNDYLAYLVERGPLGLVGLLWALWALLATGRFRVPILTIVGAAAIAGIFRETLHFRPLWFALAAGLAVSWRELGVTSSVSRPLQSSTRGGESAVHWHD